MQNAVSLTLTQLSDYLAEKQSLITDFKGINYSHAIGITKTMLYFQETESLHSRMRMFSSSLLDSLLKNKLLFQAPFISERLTFVNKELLPYFYAIYSIKDVQYKHPKSRAILNFIKSEKETTRAKIIERFELKREIVMDILSELRANFQIFMHYDGQRWTIIDPEIILAEYKMSQSTAITELVFELIRSFGPITVPQIMAMLELSGGKVSTSIIELIENKKIIRGQFIEHSSYESFLVAEELDHLLNFSTKQQNFTKQEIELLPQSDPYVKYWYSSDFNPIEEIRKITVFSFGFPICSFDYQIVGNELYVKNLRTSSYYFKLEQEVDQKIKEFAENKGKIAVLPKLRVDQVKEQSRAFTKVLVERGYFSRSSGLAYNFMAHTKVSAEYNTLYSWQDLFFLVLEYQHLNQHSQFKTKPQLLQGLSSLGIPLPLSSLFMRTSREKIHLVNETLINRNIVVSKFSSFTRGAINTDDFGLFSKLRSSRQLGILEERVLRVIKQKQKLTFSQMKQLLNLSPRVLLSALSKLERAHEVVQTKTISGKVVWMTVDDFLGKRKIKKIISAREGWLELFYRILSTNLPLSIGQLANLTGLSNTQVEIYLKELIASKGVRTGRYIEESKDTQYTTKEVEDAIMAHQFESEQKTLSNKQIEVIYIPRTDPLLILYRDFLLERFKVRSLFTRSLPSEYAELILGNGKPMAVVHYKAEDNTEYIHNVEILAEYNDMHTLMFIFSAIHDFRNKTKPSGKTKIYIKNVNNIPLKTSTGKDITDLIQSMKLDLAPI
ncbi:MAG: hypothetical protein ACTSQE_05115 [Candidatus Heimdallarchaeaceae archaeon]